MHGPMINPGAPLGQTCGVGIRVGLCRAISSFDFVNKPKREKVPEKNPLGNVRDFLQILGV
ncbi:hypothetical protein DPMN_025024 [Dreissena polymorpha]|uniref:Uncharacterized protein n=1 Tax=Dreissena polymorpha TaxID=45954 RepID=A0A9D4RD78_DREPO|nr:hypothetical protein DPMN_025024 [Dreissena polymorpha]